MDLGSHYDLAQLHQQELRLEAAERRRARDAIAAAPRRRWAGRIVGRLRRSLAGVAERPAALEPSTGENG